MSRYFRHRWLLHVLLLAAVLTASCAAPRTPDGGEDAGKLNVVATTTFVADVVSHIGGERINLQTLLPYGANPHSYQPSPQDVAAVNQADVIFANGAGLEIFLEELIDNAGGDADVVPVSERVELRSFNLQGGGGPDHEQGETDAQDGSKPHQEDGSEDGELQGVDPHVWFDPTNVMVWVENIQETLVRLDPENEEQYREQARSYRSELERLDAWIREQVADIPENNRYFVTDHTVFGYFAEEYGFQQVGAVIPAATTEAEPSGKHLAQLSDIIREYDVKAIFVSKDFDPSLSRRIAEDTGVEVVPLYFGSLTEDDGPAGTYISFMRYNVEAILGALK